MEENNEEEKVEYERKRKNIDDCVNPHGLQIDGLGVLMSHAKKQTELLDKIQKFLFFMEKRQLAWKQEFEKINKLPIEQDKSKGVLLR